jgi:hypothetical protein
LRGRWRLRFDQLRATQFALPFEITSKSAVRADKRALLARGRRNRHRDVNSATALSAVISARRADDKKKGGKENATTDAQWTRGDLAVTVA